MKTNQMLYSLKEIKEFGMFFKEGHSIKQTAEKFNVHYGTMKNYLTKFGYREKSKSLPKQRVKECHYFDAIDTPEKAYWLGFLYADGCICSTTYGKQIKLTLQLEDAYLINDLYIRLELDNKLSCYKNSIGLKCTDQHLYNTLHDLGIVEDKSHSQFRLPNIDESLMASFILGYFDGDGCITIKSTGYSVVSICCNSDQFLSEIKEWLEKHNIECRPLCKETSNRKNPLYVLYLSRRENQIKFFNAIYKDSTVYLKRKYEKFMQIPR